MIIVPMVREFFYEFSTKMILLICKNDIFKNYDYYKKYCLKIKYDIISFINENISYG